MSIYVNPLDTGCIINNVKSVWYPGQSLLTLGPGGLKRWDIFDRTGSGNLKTAPEVRDTFLYSIVKEVQSDGSGRKNPALS
jgi:hypothetical protein